jgi:hypothetical protein
MGRLDPSSVRFSVRDAVDPAARAWLRFGGDRDLCDFRIVAGNDDADHTSVLVRRFDDEGLRGFVGLAQECTHEIAPSGTVAQFQLDAACEGRKYPEILHKSTRAIVCGGGRKKKVARDKNV